MFDNVSSPSAKGDAGSALAALSTKTRDCVEPRETPVVGMRSCRSSHLFTPSAPPENRVARRVRAGGRPEPGRRVPGAFGSETGIGLGRIGAIIHLKVRRSAAVEPATPAPVDPPGTIPETFAGSVSAACAVFTFVVVFKGEGIEFEVGPGAVDRGESVGASVGSAADLEVPEIPAGADATVPKLHSPTARSTTKGTVVRTALRRLPNTGDDAPTTSLLFLLGASNTFLSLRGPLRRFVVRRGSDRSELLKPATDPDLEGVE